MYFFKIIYILALIYTDYIHCVITEDEINKCIDDQKTFSLVTLFNHSDYWYLAIIQAVNRYEELDTYSHLTYHYRVLNHNETYANIAYMEYFELADNTVNIKYHTWNSDNHPGIYAIEKKIEIFDIECPFKMGPFKIEMNSCKSNGYNISEYIRIIDTDYEKWFMIKLCLTEGTRYDYIFTYVNAYLTIDEKFKIRNELNDKYRKKYRNLFMTDLFEIRRIDAKCILKDSLGSKNEFNTKNILVVFIIIFLGRES